MTVLIAFLASLSLQAQNTPAMEAAEVQRKALQERVDNPTPRTRQGYQNAVQNQQRRDAGWNQQRANAGNPLGPDKETLNPRTGSNTGFRSSIANQQAQYRPGTPVAKAPILQKNHIGKLPAPPARAPIIYSGLPTAPAQQGQRRQISTPSKPSTASKPSFSAGFPRARGNTRSTSTGAPVYNGSNNPYGRGQQPIAPVKRSATPPVRLGAAPRTGNASPSQASRPQASRPQLRGGDGGISAPRAQYVKPAILNTTIEQRNAATKGMSPSARDAFNKKYRDAKNSHAKQRRQARQPVNPAVQQNGRAQPNARPQQNARAQSNPAVQNNGVRRPNAGNRPNAVGRPNAARPNAGNRPNAVGRPNTNSRPNGARPNASPKSGAGNGMGVKPKGRPR